MRLLSAAIALATTVCLSTSSLAASVQQVQGQVLVNAGMGYQAVRSGAIANPGAIVLAQPGGSGKVVYPDGCVVPVSVGHPFATPVHRVEEESPCRRRPHLVVPALALAGVAAATIIVLNDTDDPPSCP